MEKRDENEPRFPGGPVHTIIVFGKGPVGLHAPPQFNPPKTEKIPKFNELDKLYIGYWGPTEMTGRQAIVGFRTAGYFVVENGYTEDQCILISGLGKNDSSVISEKPDHRVWRVL